MLMTDRVIARAFVEDMVKQRDSATERLLHDNEPAGCMGGLPDMFRVKGRDQEPPGPSEASRKLVKELWPELEHVAHVGGK